MRVAVLGCGYVGLELVRQLRPVHEVVGVRRSEAGLSAVERAGGHPIQADVTDPASLAAVPTVDAVVFAASAGSREPPRARETYLAGQRTAIDALCDRATPPERYLYTSSTGVYGEYGGAWVDESTDLPRDTERRRILASAEDVALERPADYGVTGGVARLAGLYGPDRYRLGRYLEGPVAPGYLNLVHRDDAAGAIAHLLATERRSDDVTLVVDDRPVERRDFAAWLARACGTSPPPTSTGSAGARGSKRCSNAALRDLGYAFDYPTVEEGYRAAIREYRRRAAG